jgi:hypothetical protein
LGHLPGKPSPIGSNTRPQASQPGTGVASEGRCAVAGLAACGSRGRKLAIFYRGPAETVPAIPLRRPQPKIRTGDDAIELIRRLATHYSDAVIAGILNR